MKYKDRKGAKCKYKQALLATVATMTLGVSTLGSTATAFAAEHPVQELPSTFLNDLNLELSPPISSEQVAKIMRDASIDSRRLNDLLRQVTMGVVGKIPAIGSVVSAIVGSLYPEQTGTDSKLNALEAKLTAKIETKADEEHVKDIKSRIQNLINASGELQNALCSVQKAIYYDGSVKDIHGTLRDKAENVDKSFKELVPFLMQEGHDIGDLPVYTKVATAHILFLNYMKTRGTDSTLYRYDSAKTVDAQFQPADRVNTYAKHIEATFKKGDDKIVQLINELEGKKEALRNVGSSTGGSLAGGNLGAESKRSILNKEIDGLEALKLNEKRALYRDLTVAERSFEAVSGKKLTYTHFDDILSGTYKIVSKLDNKMVLNTSNHAAVLRGTNEATWGNSWTFQYDKGKKAYMITNRQGDHPGILANDWGSKEHSYVFATNDTANKPEHYWTLEPAGDGYYFIHNNALPGKVLDITGNNTANGTKINLFDKNGQDNQKFKLEKIN